MKFDSFVAIDWSGDKLDFQKGISIAHCEHGSKSPKIVKPKNKYWSRSNLVDWIIKQIEKQKTLIGFDFSFSYPFHDFHSYFPGVKDCPINPRALWKLIDNVNKNKKNFYGGGIWDNKPFCFFYNAPNFRGNLYKGRRRITEIVAKNTLHSPSPTFNCVGPGAVGTGTLAGMRVLNFLQNKAKIWPFNVQKKLNSSVVVEIFPTYYFRLSGIKPERDIGYTLKSINFSLNFYNSKPLEKNFIISGPDQDDADAIISSAALRYFSSKKNVWNIPSISQKEGWIFGV